MDWHGASLHWSRLHSGRNSNDKYSATNGPKIPENMYTTTGKSTSTLFLVEISVKSTVSLSSYGHRLDQYAYFERHSAYYNVAVYVKTVLCKHILTVKSLMEKMEESHQATKTKVAP
jgi:hypothetical protein